MPLTLMDIAGIDTAEPEPVNPWRTAWKDTIFHFEELHCRELELGHPERAEALRDCSLHMRLILAQLEQSP